MRFLALLRKTALENLRDWKILIITLLFAPFFVVLMYFYMTSLSTVYVVQFVNHDTGAVDGDASLNAGGDLLALMRNATYEDGTKILDVREAADVAGVRGQIIDRTADLIVEVPANFSGSIAAYNDGAAAVPATLRTLGDPASSKYIMAASYVDLLTYTYVSEATGEGVPVSIDVGTVRAGDAAKPGSLFDQIVPALLVLSLMMIMFSAAASIIREKDKGTMVRLRMSKITALEFIGSVSLAQVIIGVAAMGLTFLSAVALGYRGQGSLLAALVICVLCALSIIAISLIVAAFLRSIFDLMTIGCFPFFVLMFFSGGMFPLPTLQLFTLWGHPVNVNDALPTTHAIDAMGKILNYGTGLEGLVPEIAGLVILTVALFVIGLCLFRRKYMGTGG